MQRFIIKRVLIINYEGRVTHHFVSVKNCTNVSYCVSGEWLSLSFGCFVTKFQLERCFLVSDRWLYCHYTITWITNSAAACCHTSVRVSLSRRSLLVVVVFFFASFCFAVAVCCYMAAIAGRVSRVRFRSFASIRCLRRRGSDMRYLREQMHRAAAARL